MAKKPFDEGMWSEKRTADRRKLRQLARQVSMAINRDYDQVLVRLVKVQWRGPNGSQAHPEAVRLEMQLHEAEGFAELTREIIEMLGTEVLPETPGDDRHALIRDVLDRLSLQPPREVGDIAVGDSTRDVRPSSNLASM